MKDSGKTRTSGSRRRGEIAARRKPRERFDLRLYVTGTTRRSTLAIAGIRRVCERYLRGHYDLQIIDLYQQPTLARDDQIVAVPTLVKRHPAPLRRLVGDMSYPDRILEGLGMRASR
jgi:circadian clock protein KaiB